MLKHIINEESLREAVKKCLTRNQVLLYLKLNNSSSSYKILNNNLNKYNIDISHFLSASERICLSFQKGSLYESSNESIFISNSSTPRATLRKRVLRDNLIKYQCSLCDHNDMWRGKKMSLILDHIDGDRYNNILTNLRFVCPNCNATLDTHCLGKRDSRKKINSKKVDRRTKRYNKITTGSEYKPRPQIRKVERPSKEELIILIKSNTWRSLGKKFGVSDVAVRKWAKLYLLV